MREFEIETTDALFDAEEYLFEVKWNGIRALAAREAGGWCLWGRDRIDFQQRYPELAILSALPIGTVLDGELVLFSQGLPDLYSLLARHQRTRWAAVRHLSRSQPVTYVVFDALRDNQSWLLGRPLEQRRCRARECVAALQDARVVFSEGVLGRGRDFFAAAVQQGQEGVMAKHLSSRYLPGRRSAAWKKIKPVQHMPVVIIGYEPGTLGVRSLLVAALWQGSLRYVARLRSGLSLRARQELAALLKARRCRQPVVPCAESGPWVEPELYCRVRFLQWTVAGKLVGASYAGLLTPPFEGCP